MRIDGVVRVILGRPDHHEIVGHSYRGPELRDRRNALRKDFVYLDPGHAVMSEDMNESGAFAIDHCSWSSSQRLRATPLA